MRSNLFIISFLTFSFAINLELSKQNPSVEDSRIAWGTRVESINEYPFNLAIAGMYESGGGELLCSASLINHEWIVTAAHCVEQIQNYDFGSAILGSARMFNNLETTLTESVVLEMFVHPLYNAQTGDNDIALFRIEPVEFNEGIQPILLSNTLPLDQTRLKITGYGFSEPLENSNGLEYPDFGNLREADKTLMIDGSWPAESDIIYALGSTVNSYNQEPCAGDSGGPLFKVSPSCDDCVVDFTAYGAECCDTAWYDFGLTCAMLEGDYFWECGGCNCPGDLSCEEQGLVTCEFESVDGTGCAIDLSRCLEYGQCPDNQIFDCDGDGCWPQLWVGDGICDDGSDYSVDLSCYDNDGGDCDRLLSSNTRIRSIDMPNSNSRNDNEFELVGVTSFALTGCEDGWGYSGFQNIYYHLDWINSTMGISSHAGDVIQDGEVNILDVVALVEYILFGSNLTIEQLANGDFTQDGEVNVLDVVAIVEIILE